jgi:hypothetical protein
MECRAAEPAGNHTSDPAGLYTVGVGGTGNDRQGAVALVGPLALVGAVVLVGAEARVGAREGEVGASAQQDVGDVNSSL